MTTSTSPARRALRRGLTLAVGAAIALGTSAATTIAPATAAAPNKNGIVCTNGGPSASAGQPVFDLTTRTGYIDLPDGNTSYMWGYSNGFDDFQHPGPVLCVHEGDDVTVILHNTLDVDASIVFPGQHEVLADGLPSQPVVDGGGFMTSLAPPAAAQTGTVTYTFTADHAGTFLYESGTDPETQVRMGLFGALIVRPTADTDGDLRPGLRLGRHEVHQGRGVHGAALGDRPVPARGGRAGQDVQHEQLQGALLADQRPRATPTASPTTTRRGCRRSPTGRSPRSSRSPTPSDHPLPGMARYLSVGSEDYPFHPHGNNGLVVGRDGHELRNGSNDMSMEKFAINIGPGQTWDVLFGWYDAEDYGAGQPGDGDRPEPGQPGGRHLLQRQPVPREDRTTCHRECRPSTSAGSSTSSRTTTPCSRSPPGA